MVTSDGLLQRSSLERPPVSMAVCGSLRLCASGRIGRRASPGRPRILNWRVPVLSAALEQRASQCGLNESFTLRRIKSARKVIRQWTEEYLLLDGLPIEPAAVTYSGDWARALGIGQSSHLLPLDVLEPRSCGVVPQW